MWRDDRWLIVGDKKFGVVSYVLVGGSGGILPEFFLYSFPPLELKFEHFLKQIFGNSVTLCFDRLNPIS